MEGLTISFGQRDWKFVVEYGFKWYQKIDLDNLPSVFNIKDTVKAFLTRESIFSKIKKTIFSFATKIPFFKKWENQTQNNYREYRSINIPITKEQRETQKIEVLS